MEHRIVQLPQLTLVGLSFFGNPFQLSGAWTEENEIGRLWVRFHQLWKEQRNIFPPIQAEDASYELHIMHPETMERGEYEVFAGVEANQAAPCPALLSYKVLPASAYAVFTLVGEQIISDWYYAALQDWMRQGEVQVDPAYSMLRYDARFKGMQRIAESSMEVYLPLRSC
jgi:predicted transcriptional regulator YdeE